MIKSLYIKEGADSCRLFICVWPDIALDSIAWEDSESEENASEKSTTGDADSEKNGSRNDYSEGNDLVDGLLGDDTMKDNATKSIILESSSQFDDSDLLPKYLFYLSIGVQGAMRPKSKVLWQKHLSDAGMAI